MTLNTFAGLKYIGVDNATFIQNGPITAALVSQIVGYTGSTYLAVLGSYYYDGVVTSELCNTLRSSLYQVALVKYKDSDETEEIIISNSYVSWLQLTKEHQAITVKVQGTVLSGVVDSTLLETLRTNLSYEAIQLTDVPDGYSSGGTPGSPFDLEEWCDLYLGDDSFVVCSATSFDSGVSGTALRDAVLAKGPRTNFAYSLSPDTWVLVTESSDEILKTAMMAHGSSSMSVLINVRGVIGQLPAYTVAAAEISLPYVLAASQGTIQRKIVGKNLFIAVGCTQISGSTWSEATTLSNSWHIIFSSKDVTLNDLCAVTEVQHSFSTVTNWEAVCSGYSSIQARYRVQNGWEGFTGNIELNTITVPGVDPDPLSNSLVTATWEPLVTDTNEILVATP